MWHIILDPTDNRYIVVSSVDGITDEYLEDVQGSVWTEYLLNFVRICKDNQPEPLDDWIYERDLIEVLSFKSEDPIAFTRSLRLTHPELFI